MPHAKKSARRPTSRKSNAAPKMRYEVFVSGDGFFNAYPTKEKAMAAATRRSAPAYVRDRVTGKTTEARKPNVARSRQSTYGGTIEPGLLEDWRRSMPRGTHFYGVLKSRAGGDTVKVVFAVDDGRIYRVPPNMGIAAGYRHNREKDGFLLGGRGLDDFAKAIGKYLYGDERAFEAEPWSYL